MATSVGQASTQPTARDAAGSPAPTHRTTAPANDHERPGTDPMDFVRANRIQVEHGSLFIDPYLVVHPRELAPENEAKLRAKLQLTYSLNNPTFFESDPRRDIAKNLGALIAVPLQDRHDQLIGEVEAYNKQVDSGVDSKRQQQIDDKSHPFAAIVRETTESEAVDPAETSLRKNGLGMYLLLREKLTQNHYLNRLTDYVKRTDSADQVLQELADKIGVTPAQVTKAANEGGLDAVGALLGLDPRYVDDVKQLTEHAAAQDFGYNMIEHWHLGRQLLGIEATLEDKITTGMDARITAKIAEYRGRVRHHFEVPEPIQQEEARIAREDLMLLEPIQRQLLFIQGYEICYTPEYTADGISFNTNAYGIHRRTNNESTSLIATNRIFYSGHGSLKGQSGTLAHEAAHDLWPNYFAPDEAAKIDALAASDAQRFGTLSQLLNERFDDFERLLTAYHAGDAAEKTAVISAANDQFAEYGITVDELFPHLPDAVSFRFLVWDANNQLQTNGAFYERSDYKTPQDRFREVISRFAEARQVSHHHEPEVLKFVAPGLTSIWQDHYIPHLHRVYADMEAAKDAGPLSAGVAMAHNVVPMPFAANDDAKLVQETAAGTPVKPAMVVQAETVQAGTRVSAPERTV